MKRISVIGGGSWGTALVLLLSNNLSRVGWWVRTEKAIDYMKSHRRNPNYLSYTELPIEKLHISNSMQEIIEASDILVLAIPAAFLKQSLEEAGIKTLKGKFVISAIKGIVPEHNMVITEFLETYYEVEHSTLGFIVLALVILKKWL